MATARGQLDRRFSEFKTLEATRPPRGWIHAIREALGMTTSQFAKRLNVQQPRVIELERGEATGNITVKSLERAAAALGCHLVYVLIPEVPLAETVRKRASSVANQKLAYVGQTMRLEAQEVLDKAQHKEAHQKLVTGLLRHPSRLWQ